MHARDEKPRLVRHEPPVPLEEPRLREVVGFLTELPLRLGGDGVDVRAAREQIEQAQQRRDVVDVGTIERATPGYWIFSATSRPSRVRARWTSPIDAAATGSSSNRSKRPPSPGRIRGRARAQLRSGIGSAPARSRRAPRAPRAAGTLRSERESCPSFIAAPRSRARRCASRRTFGPVNSVSPATNRSPSASRRSLPRDRRARARRPPGRARTGGRCGSPERSSAAGMHVRSSLRAGES